MTPLLPLDTFRQIAKMNPYFFWQLQDTTAGNNSLRVGSNCAGLLKQYAWQNADFAGRSDISEAIEMAEAKLRGYLRYSVAPRYIANETVPWPHYNDSSLVRSWSVGGDGRQLSVKLNEGYIQVVGVETLSAISLGQAVTINTDANGYVTSFTMSFATTVTEISQIALYFNAANRVAAALYTGDTSMAPYRIEPINVTISAGVATVTGSAWLLVSPAYYEDISSGTLSPSGGAHFPTTLDVYRRYPNPNGTTVETAQGMLIWETNPCAGWWCCGASTTTPANSSQDPAAQAFAVARVGIRNSVSGEVTPGEALYNATTGVWYATPFDTCYEPDRVQIRYLAGLPLDTQGHMQREWAIIVARLAMAELSRPICDSSTTQAGNREVYHWQFDLARTTGANDESYGAITQDDLGNPFGTRRGHVQAWRAVQNNINLRGFLP